MRLSALLFLSIVLTGSAVAAPKKGVTRLPDSGLAQPSVTKIACTPVQLTNPDPPLCNAEFGWVLTSGDITGNGSPEIIVGAPHTLGQTGCDPGDPGRVHIYSSDTASDMVQDFELMGERLQDRFGVAVATGDVNGDRIADLAVGADRHDSAGPNTGRVYLYLGGTPFDTSPDLILDGQEPDDNFGRTVAIADVTGDGKAELLVGAPGERDGFMRGKLFTYPGGNPPRNAPSVLTPGPFGNGNFGYSLANAGDWNGDGFEDVIVGEPFTFPGYAYILPGALTFNPFVSSPVIALVGERPGDRFGYSVASAGDFLNGDGRAEVIVGAPFHHGCSPSSGRAYLFAWDAATRFSRSLIEPPFCEHLFGSAVSAAGDINGDGVADIAVATKDNDLDTPSFGWIHVFCGGAYCGNQRKPQVGAPFGKRPAVASAGDFTGDGLDDLIWGNPGLVYGDGHVGFCDFAPGN